jgi:hypothetical protein
MNNGKFTHCTHEFGHLFLARKKGIGAKAPIRKNHMLSPYGAPGLNMRAGAITCYINIGVAGCEYSPNDGRSVKDV